MLIETSQTEKQREKEWKRIFMNCGRITRGITCIMGISEEERETGTEIL